MARRRLSAALLGLASAIAAAGAVGASEGEARANGRFPASNSVFFVPGDDATAYVRVTFGLLVTHDTGKSWRWICEKAIGFSSMEDPTYVVTPSGAIVAGLFEGIRVSRDGGCTWTSVDVDGAKVFVDVTMRGSEVVALASSFDKAGDAGSLFKSRVFVSKDDAHTFQVAGAPLDPSLLSETIEVGKSDPSRAYVSAARGDAPPRTGVLLASKDRGLTWSERAIPLGPKELAPYIAAVDPANADRVYVRTTAPPEETTHLLVTADGGKTWKTLLDAKGPLPGFALGASSLYAGGPEAGGWAGTGDALSKVTPVRVQCMGLQGDVLWACSSEPSGFVVGRSRDGAKTFEPLLHLRDIQGPLACVSSCDAEWARLQSDLGITSADAGAAPAPSAWRPSTAGIAKPDAPNTWLAWAGVAAAIVVVVIVVARRRA